MSYSIEEIASWIGAQIDGDKDIEISGLAKIEQAQKGHLSFIANPKYQKFIETTNASAVLVDKNFPVAQKTLLRVENPYFSFLQLTKRFYHQQSTVDKGIHQTAVIGSQTQMGKDVAIGPYAVIGKECQIGDNAIIYPGVVIDDQVQIGQNTILYPNVTIREKCKVGSNCIVHMGAVIGSDGFGFAFEQGQYHKLPQMGIVIIEDDVEIGANTTIDRATMGETIIRKGCKLDNLIQIAHNVEIDEHTAIAAQTGISGSTKIGKYVQIGGQAGFTGHLKIGDKAKVGAQAGVTKSIAENDFVSGYPARPFRREMKEHAALTRLPELLRMFKALEKKVDELSKEIEKFSG